VPNSGGGSVAEVSSTFTNVQLVPLRVTGIVSAVAVELKQNIPIAAATPQAQANLKRVIFDCIAKSFLDAKNSMMRI
jgi:hypothetical protein